MPLYANKNINDVSYRAESTIPRLKPNLEVQKDAISQHIESPLYISKEKSTKSKLKKIINITVFTVCLSIMIILVYNAFKFDKIPSNIDDIPVVKASLNPIKIIPSDSGGIKVPNQDKLIYLHLQDPSFKLTEPDNIKKEFSEDTNTSLRTPQIIKKVNSSSNSDSTKSQPKSDVKKSNSTNPLASKATIIVKPNINEQKSSKTKSTKPKSNPFLILDNQ